MVNLRHGFSFFFIKEIGANQSGQPEGQQLQTVAKLKLQFKILIVFIYLYATQLLYVLGKINIMFKNVAIAPY